MGVRGERQGAAHKLPLRREGGGFIEGQQQRRTEETTNSVSAKKGKPGLLGVVGQAGPGPEACRDP